MKASLALRLSLQEIEARAYIQANMVIHDNP